MKCLNKILRKNSISILNGSQTKNSRNCYSKFLLDKIEFKWKHKNTLCTRTISRPLKWFKSYTKKSKSAPLNFHTWKTFLCTYKFFSCIFYPTHKLLPLAILTHEQFYPYAKMCRAKKFFIFSVYSSFKLFSSTLEY